MATPSSPFQLIHVSVILNKSTKAFSPKSCALNDRSYKIKIFQQYSFNRFPYFTVTRQQNHISSKYKAAHSCAQPKKSLFLKFSSQITEKHQNSLFQISFKEKVCVKIKFHYLSDKSLDNPARLTIDLPGLFHSMLASGMDFTCNQVT